MAEEIEASVPTYLQELLQLTPSGTAKLIAVWDGLTTETQIAVLAAKEEQPGPAYLYQQIVEKALTSDNAFVRYIAAKQARYNDREGWDESLRRQIETDPDPLVRYAHLERDRGAIHDSELTDPDKFFSLPHEARLAKVRRLTDGGKFIAELILYAVEHLLTDSKVSDGEIREVLLEYVNKPEFKEGFRQDQEHQDQIALWKLVLKVPEHSRVLIEHLPGGSFSRGGDVPNFVLQGISDDQLVALFHRSDIGVEGFRKQKFFEAPPEVDEDERHALIRERIAHFQRNVDESDLAPDRKAALIRQNAANPPSVRDEEIEKVYLWSAVRRAAIAHCFDLTNEEFAVILEKPDELRVRDLEDLKFAADLRLCLHEAVHDVLAGWKIDLPWSAFRKLEKLEGPERDEELTELKLYRLAVQTVPWEKDKKGTPPAGDLAFFKDAVMEGDTWATFMKFSKRWEGITHCGLRKRIERNLPGICEAGEEGNTALDAH